MTHNTLEDSLNVASSSRTSDVLQPPTVLCQRLNCLAEERILLLQQQKKCQEKLDKGNAYLAISQDVTDALKKLADQLFGNIKVVIEKQLSLALREILEQDLQLKVDTSKTHGGVAKLVFFIEREGQREEVLKGQGGSVANILSVGLRFFALTTLDEKEHRRFLVLDEQDCWLHPDLVPRLVKIVHQICKTLHFQVLMVSHHDVAAFDRYADRIYQLTPTGNGVVVKRHRDAHFSASDKGTSG